jgi:hypothetical protein
MASKLTVGAWVLGGSLIAVACGARSSLDVEDAVAAGGSGGAVPCEEGDTLVCGSDVGICEKGLQTCHDGAYGPCEGDVGPRAELCNDLDDDCDGAIDEDFALDTACDGPDTDLCSDDLMTCDGCSLGPNTLEICNGVDDNCNGIVDADCEVGDCSPTLEVTGSTPSSPSCIDFPITAGSVGTINYPCTGGLVTAVLGGVELTGSVVNGEVSLDGEVTLIGPDECLWLTSHHIGGNISSGMLTYFYGETLLTTDWPACWQPCTEWGEVTIQWEIR